MTRECEKKKSQFASNSLKSILFPPFGISRNIEPSKDVRFTACLTSGRLAMREDLEGSSVEQSKYSLKNA
jgi:hypothetical protein